jgi:Novel STAND NTPase 1/WD domain, G-beta repeat
MGRPERLIDLDDGPVAEFAAGLRRLREQVGRPSYRELSQRASFSVTVLSEAAGGRALPTLPVALAYVRACGGDVGEWEQRWRMASAYRRVSVAAGVAPYRGLACYDVQDAGLFFGRGALTRDLVRRVTGGRFLAVFGASGCGKSSLLRAGLAAAVAGGEVEAAARWKVSVFTPGSRPIAALASAVTTLTRQDRGGPASELAAGPGWLAAAVKEVGASGPARAAVLLVVDQFEELFTVCSDESERGCFIDALLDAVSARDGQVRVVVGVRADFYAQCSRWPGLVRVLRDGQLLIAPMSTEDLHDVIVKPAAACGVTVDRALLARLVADAGGEPGALPLVSHALLETWRRRRAGRLTLAGYLDAGGVAGAIAATAEDIYLACDPQQRQMLRRVLLRLVTPGEGELGGVQQRLQPGDLAAGDDPGQVAALVDRLACCRLVTVDDGGVRIAHEALIRHWPRLAGWLADSRDGLRIQRRLAAAAATWEGFSRDSGVLYRGTPLAVASAWADHDSDLTGLSRLERDFLDASAAAEQSEFTRAQRAKRLRSLAATLAALLVVVSGTAGLVLWQRQAALIAQRAAMSAQYATQASELATTNPYAAGLAALAAWRTMPTPAARSALLGTSQLCPSYSCRGSPLPFLQMPADGRFGVVASSQDSTFIASYTDSAIRLWDIASGRQVADISLPIGPNTPVAFSQHGGLLATITGGGGVQVWDTARHMLVGVLAGKGVVTDVAFSPNGRLLSAASTSGVYLWDLGTGRSVNLSRKSGDFAMVAFSPRGAALATAMFGRTVTIWDITEPAHPKIAHQLNGPAAAQVYDLAYSPRGDMLAAGAYDGTVELWDLNHGTLALLQAPSGVAALAFNYDETTLAGLQPDSTADSLAFTVKSHTLNATGPGTVTVWSIAKRSVVATLPIHPAMSSSNILAAPNGQSISVPVIFAWDLDPDRAAQRICQVLTDDHNLHADEMLVPSASYKRLCPTKSKP